MKAQRGFTLIELIIVVAIIALLAGIAWPSYQEHVKTTRRADAQGALMALAQAMERHFTDKGTYSGAADNNGIPTIFAGEAPLDGGAKFYNLRITAADGTSYTLQAQPKNGQAGDGNLQLKSSGQKAWDRDNDGSLTDAGDLCWSKSCS
ncbi:type IV pilin protein [Microbulbifer bruguierae]|uniref:Type IV pilin protein n=1 Tax=Microbulbifer bruguierae TaxID=3029061 RepID=A0ABY8NHW9_9GAMM|nr:type IV pilin protein [Microbulbifer bruguierae]WGL18192.1 type IV pilin protein [Microbulbifer bruguierae]